MFKENIESQPMEAALLLSLKAMTDGTATQPLILHRLRDFLPQVSNSGTSIEQTLTVRLPELFELRMAVLIWALENLWIFDNLQAVDAEFQQLSSGLTKKIDLSLLEETLKAWQTLSSVASQILGAESTAAMSAASLYELTYEKVQLSIQMGPMPARTKAALIELLDSSLQLEFSVLLGYAHLTQYSSLPELRVVELIEILRKSRTAYEKGCSEIWNVSNIRQTENPSGKAERTQVILESAAACFDGLTDEQIRTVEESRIDQQHLFRSRG